MKFYLFVFLGNKKRKGFSLIETLVAMAVGVIVFGFITDLMIKQQKEQKFIAQKLEQSDFKNNLLSIFSKRNNCTCQFLNNSTNPNQTNYSNLQFNSNNTSGSEVINANALYSGCAGTPSPILLAANNQPLHGSQTLIVDTVRIVNLMPSGGSLNPNEWQGQWEIKFKVATGSLDRPAKPVTISQKFMIDPTVPTAARITACEGVSSGSGTVNYLPKWSSVPGVIEDSVIYQDPLNGNNMGIGTATPFGTLEVNGGIRSKKGLPNNFDLSQRGFVFEQDGDSGMFSVGGNTSSNSDLVFMADNAERVRIANNGNMGIGTTNPQSKLEVNGEARIGNTGVACSGANEGAVRYNSGAKIMEYCNAVSWQTLTGPPGAAGAAGAAGPPGPALTPTVTIRTNTVTAPGPFAMSVSCAGTEKLTGGGGLCSSAIAYALMVHSYPSGNTWNLGCGHVALALTTATAYAICVQF